MTEVEVLDLIRRSGDMVRGVSRPYRTSFFAGCGPDKVNITRQVNALIRKGVVSVEMFAIQPGPYHRVCINRLF